MSGNAPIFSQTLLVSTARNGFNWLVPELICYRWTPNRVRRNEVGSDSLVFRGGGGANTARLKSVNTWNEKSWLTR